MGDVIELDQRQFEHIGPDDWPGELVWARKSDGLLGEAVYVGLFVVPRGHVFDGAAPLAWVRVMCRREDGLHMHDVSVNDRACAQILTALGGVPRSRYWRAWGTAVAVTLCSAVSMIIGWLS